MTTMRDIARTAGVSLGTVSNYFNSPDRVAKETGEAIREAIKKLDYHPHAAARSLKTNQTRRIGLVPLISLEDNYSVDPGDYAFLEFLSGVNTGLAGLGYDLLLSAATSPAKEAAIYDRLVGERQVDGMILMGMRADDERVRQLMELNFPFITYGQTNSARPHAFVDVDGGAGLVAAVNYLAHLGHKRIAYITPPPGFTLAGQRWAGFTRAMQDNQLPVLDELIEPGDFSERSGQAAMHILLDLPEPPTAVLTANDLCAFGAMRALQSRGFKVGKDVSVVGFDNIGYSAHWQPPLTTIAQPFREIGIQCANLVVQMVAGKETLPQKIIAPRLVERQSTGPLNLT
jgi:LacI family transcriptional regulator